MLLLGFHDKQLDKRKYEAENIEFGAQDLRLRLFYILPIACCPDHLAWTGTSPVIPGFPARAIYTPDPISRSPPASLAAPPSSPQSQCSVFCTANKIQMWSDCIHCSTRTVFIRNPCILY